MILPPIQPVLAIDANAIVGIIVLVISVASWIINVFQGNNPDGTPRQKKAVPREKAQTDLEKFLQDVLTGKSEADQQKQKKSAPPVPKQKSQRGSGDKKSRKNQTQQKNSQPSETTTSSRPGEDLAKSHLRTSQLGEGIRTHVKEHLGQDQIGTAVKKDIDGHVRNDLGSDESAQLNRREVPAHPIALALRDPKNVRQAIVLSEILNKPKSLR